MAKIKKLKVFGYSPLFIIGIILLSTASWRLYQIVNKGSSDILNWVANQYTFLSFLSNEYAQGVVLLIVIVLLLILIKKSGKEIFHGVLGK